MGKRFADYYENEELNSPNPREIWHMNAMRQFVDDLADLQDKYIEELDELTGVVEAQGEYIKELEKKLDPLSREIESQEIMKKQFNETN